MIMRKSLLAILLTLLVTACSTPEPVHDLANITAANASLVNTTLQAFAKDSQKTRERRMQYISDVHDMALELETNYKGRLGAMERVEKKSDQKAGNTRSAMVVSTISYLDELESDIDAAIAEKAVLEAALGKYQRKLELPAEHLKALSEKLAILGKDSNLKESLEFLRKYFGEVVKQYKASQADAKTSNETAAKKAEIASTSVQKQADLEIQQADGDTN